MVWRISGGQGRVELLEKKRDWAKEL